MQPEFGITLPGTTRIPVALELSYAKELLALPVVAHVPSPLVKTEGMAPLLPPADVLAPSSELRADATLPEIAPVAEPAVAAQAESRPVNQAMRMRAAGEFMLAPEAREATLLPESGLRLEAMLPEMQQVEMPVQAEEPQPVIDAVRIRVIDEDALAPETPEEVVVDLELAPAPAGFQAEGVPAVPAPALEHAKVAEEMAQPGHAELPALQAKLQPLEEVERGGPRDNVVELPVAVHIEPELAIPHGSQQASLLAELLEAPEYFTGLALSVGVVEYAKLVSEHGKPVLEQVLIALERTLQSVVREQDMICRVSDDEWILVCPREIAGAAKRRSTLLSEKLWDFQLRSLGGVSIFFSWGTGEGQSEKLSALVGQAHEDMQQTRHMRRGAINLAPRTRRRAVNG
jgi:GGDEF domain-containing protein